MKAGELRRVAAAYTFEISSLISQDMQRLKTGISFDMGYRSDGEVLQLLTVEYLVKANSDKRDEEPAVVPESITEDQFKTFIDHVKEKTI